MSVKTVFIGSAAIVLLGAGVWLVKSNGNPHDGTTASNRETPFLSVPQDPVRPQLALEPSDEIVSADTSPKGDASNIGRRSAKVMALAFAGRENSDPGLSAELEFAVQRALATSIDYGRFDVESVICRQADCQVISTDRNPPTINAGGPPDMRNGWGPNVAKLMTRLNDVTIHNPGSGAPMEKAELLQVTQLHEGGIVTLVRFKEKRTSLF